MPHSSRSVAVIGAGTIGLSWAVTFAARGWAVRVHDPRDDVEQVVHDGLEQFAPALRNPVRTAAVVEQVRVCAELAEAVAGAEVVQENGPEDVEFKRGLFGELERLAPADALLASSTSGLLPSEITRDLDSAAGRTLVAHPVNPPHLLPLVELVPGRRTTTASLDRAAALYRSLGKQPVVLRAEIPGFVANRLQSALFREAVHLVLSGVVTPGELDTVITESLGPRWAVAGPFLSYHLGGGPGGFRHFLHHLGPGMAARWPDLGSPRLDRPTIERLIDMVEQDLPDSSYEELTTSRDQRERAILRARDHAETETGDTT